MSRTQLLVTALFPEKRDRLAVPNIGPYFNSLEVHFFILLEACARVSN
jgi:hypothetical protein